jgi:colanic acid biosynthesis glycosyl transferase WcaI
MPRILILSLVFPPDNVSTAQIMADLSEDLKARGHDVTVITTTPHYNQDADAERAQPMTRDGRWYRKSDFRGIPVIHTVMAKKGQSIVKRVLSWLGFHALSTRAAMKLSPKPEVIIAPSPPLTIGVSAWMIARKHRAKFVYNVQEIYPDIAVKLGALRNTKIIAALHVLERFVYRKAGAVTVIGPRMKENLVGKGVPDAKVHVIPNFVDIGVLSPLPKDNEFSRAHGVAGTFVVSYAGNMGPAQGLETFVEAAALLRDRNDVAFMMMGNGILRDQLEAEVRRLGLPNFIFLPQQPFSLVRAIYATSDINLVPLAAGTGTDAIPSKVYRIMACERPILACADATSELAALVESAECGAVVEPGDAPALADVIARAADDRETWRRYGEQGREYVLRHYTRDGVTREYARLITALSTRP